MDQNIKKKLDTLSPREQRVVRMKTGIGMNTKYSLKLLINFSSLQLVLKYSVFVNLISFIRYFLNYLLSKCKINLFLC